MRFSANLCFYSHWAWQKKKQSTCSHCTQPYYMKWWKLYEVNCINETIKERQRKQYANKLKSWVVAVSLSLSTHTQNRKNENENKLRINHSTDAIAVVTMCMESSAKLPRQTHRHTSKHLYSKTSNEFCFVTYSPIIILQFFIAYNMATVVVGLSFEYGCYIFLRCLFEALNTLAPAQNFPRLYHLTFS